METFPNQYGLCECTDILCTDVFSLCQTSFTTQLDFFAGAFSNNVVSGPTMINVPGYIVWSFNGANTIQNNWLQMGTATQASFLSVTDDFTISFWIRIRTDSNSQYILACELDRNRYFSLYDASADRLIFYYFRDSLPGFGQADDDGYTTQVALSYYYDSAVFPNGLRDNQWHFVTFTVNYPITILSIDGYEQQPTRGNYRNQFNSQILFNRDGSTYTMPAPILTKTANQIASLSCKIGGSQRGNSFSLNGEMRQFTLTDILSETDHRLVLASTFDPCY